ncbi:Gmad2 immunoglobulin-like domain-containing protein [Nocardia inohanensis]|uniref:Gmad2 immunoglobulin-like domain-containing protein n=1 Tax=Nocardia inohanensis TaxID=209246 RepID=UPI000B0821F9|nr:Gmad2 immunoglobulin-like domain-containing protein [Nocardia inohanensis]
MSTESQPPGRRPATPALVIAAVAVVLALAVTLYFTMIRDSGDESTGTATTTGQSTDRTVTTSGNGPAPGQASSTTVPTATGGTGPTTASGPKTFAFQPLWPFADAAAAAEWQRSYRDGGHQPWHLEPAATASSFTTGYLGYTGVDQVLQTTVRGDEAWVTVGFANPNAVPVPAAMLHLAKLGNGDDAPWEVVGTEDRTLSLTSPGYGARITSPVTIAGRITGVDESLHLRILQLNATRPVGETSGVPAGGQDSAWSATVPFTAACPGALTIAVATGGHLQEVERFALTAAHC